MDDGVWLAITLIGFFILRIVFATIFFVCILPDDGRCPCCNAMTVGVESKWFNRLMPWFRTSWCYDCGWHGVLRHIDPKQLHH